MVEHMAFDSSTDYPGRGGIWNQWFEIATSINAFTSFRTTTYMAWDVAYSENNLKKALNIHLNQVSKLTPDANNALLEQGAVASEARFRNSSFSQALNDVLNNHFNNRISQRDPIGTPLAYNYTPAMITNFQKKWYTPDRMQLFLVGDFPAKTDAEFDKAKTDKTLSPQQVRSVDDKIVTIVKDALGIKVFPKATPEKHPEISAPDPITPGTFYEVSGLNGVTTSFLITEPLERRPWIHNQYRQEVDDMFFSAIYTISCTARLHHLYPEDRGLEFQDIDQEEGGFFTDFTGNRFIGSFLDNDFDVATKMTTILIHSPGDPQRSNWERELKVAVQELRRLAHYGPDKTFVTGLVFATDILLDAMEDAQGWMASKRLINGFLGDLSYRYKFQSFSQLQEMITQFMDLGFVDSIARNVQAQAQWLLKSILASSGQVSFDSPGNDAKKAVSEWSNTIYGKNKYFTGTLVPTATMNTFVGRSYLANTTLHESLPYSDIDALDKTVTSDSVKEIIRQAVDAHLPFNIPPYALYLTDFEFTDIVALEGINHFDTLIDKEQLPKAGKAVKDSAKSNSDLNVYQYVLDNGIRVNLKPMVYTDPWNYFNSSSLQSDTFMWIPFSIITRDQIDNTPSASNNRGRFISDLLHFIFYFDFGRVVKSCPKLSGKCLKPRSREKMKFNLVYRYASINNIHALSSIAALLATNDDLLKYSSHIPDNFISENMTSFLSGNDITPLDELDLIRLILLEKYAKLHVLQTLPSKVYPQLYTIVSQTSYMDWYATAAGLSLMLTLISSFQTDHTTLNSQLQLADTILLLESLRNIATELRQSFIPSQCFNGLLSYLASFVGLAFKYQNSYFIQYSKLNQDWIENTFSVVRNHLGRRAATTTNILRVMSLVHAISTLSITSTVSNSSYRTVNDVATTESTNNKNIQLQIKSVNILKQQRSLFFVPASFSHFVSKIPLSFKFSDLSILAMNGMSFTCLPKFKTGQYGRIPIHQWFTGISSISSQFPQIILEKQEYYSSKLRAASVHSVPSWSNNDEIDVTPITPMTSTEGKFTQLKWSDSYLEPMIIHLAGYILLDIFIHLRAQNVYKRLFDNYRNRLAESSIFFYKSINDDSSYCYPNDQFIAYIHVVFQTLESYFPGEYYTSPVVDLRNRIFINLKSNSLVRQASSKFIQLLPESAEIKFNLSILQLATESLACLFIRQLTTLNKPGSIFSGKYSNQLLGIRSLTKNTFDDLPTIRNSLQTSDIIFVNNSEILHKAPVPKNQDSYLTIINDALIRLPQLIPAEISTLLGIPYPFLEKVHVSSSKPLSPVVERQLICDRVYTIVLEYQDISIDPTEDPPDDNNITQYIPDDIALIDDASTGHFQPLESFTTGLQILGPDASTTAHNFLGISVIPTEFQTPSKLVSLFCESTLDTNPYEPQLKFSTTPEARKWTHWHQEAHQFFDSKIEHFRDVCLNHIVSLQKIDFSSISFLSFHDNTFVNPNYFIGLESESSIDLISILPQFPLFNDSTVSHNSIINSLLFTPANLKGKQVDFSIQLLQSYSRILLCHMCLLSLDNPVDASKKLTLHAIVIRKDDVNHFLCEKNEKLLDYLSSNSIISRIAEMVHLYTCSRTTNGFEKLSKFYNRMKTSLELYDLPNLIQGKKLLRDVKFRDLIPSSSSSLSPLNDS